jgi:microcystin-dependent protein
MSIPIGVIIPYAGASAPIGFLLCDGTSYSQSGIYSGLFAAIGYTYGNDNGNFRVPNLQDRRPRMVNSDGSGIGATGGSDTSAISVEQMPSHDHSGANFGITHSHGQQNYTVYIAVNKDSSGRGNDGGFNTTVCHTGANTSYANNASIGNATPTISGDLADFGSGSSFNVLNPNLCMYYYIRY